MCRHSKTTGQGGGTMKRLAYDASSGQDLSSRPITAQKRKSISTQQIVNALARCVEGTSFEYALPGATVWKNPGDLK